MEIAKSASLIIYRIREKGLEVFLLNKENDGGKWELPKQNMDNASAVAIPQDDKVITLDPVKHSDGAMENGFAVEGDWHDIPSLKSLVMEDVQFVKDQIKQIIPDVMEKGTFVAVKEAFKRVLPHQYEMLKELKDIISDRNSVKDM